MVKQSQVKRRKSLANLIVLFSIHLILLIIEECLNIVISVMNQDQEQIYLIANYNIVATTSKILILLSFLYSMFTLKLNTYFQHQVQYLGIFYLLFYVCFLQIVMTWDLTPRRKECDENEKSRDDDGKCFQDSKYKGWKTVEFAHYIQGTNSALLFYFTVLIKYLQPGLDRLSDKANNIKQSQILKTKKKALIALCLFIFYSICKIILYIITLIMNENTSTQLLVCSNIFYHLILIILWLKIMITILFDKKQEYNCYENYIQLIYQISNIGINNFFSILAWMSVGFTIFGIRKCNLSEGIGINFDTFVLFDCFLVQAAAQLFFQTPYLMRSIQKLCGYPDEIQINNTTNQELNQNQVIQTHHATESRQPLNLNIQIQETQNCWFCLEGLTNDKNKPTIQLKCDPSHVFHLLCVQEWLDTCQKCPICKTEIKPD